MINKEYEVVQRLISRTLKKEMTWERADAGDVILDDDSHTIVNTPYKSSFNNYKIVVSQKKERINSGQIIESWQVVASLQIISNEEKKIWEIKNESVEKLYNTVKYRIENVDDILDSFLSL